MCPRAGSSGPGCDGQGWKASFSSNERRPPPVHQRVVQPVPAAVFTLELLDKNSAVVQEMLSLVNHNENKNKGAVHPNMIITSKQQQYGGFKSQPSSVVLDLTAALEMFCRFKLHQLSDNLESR